MSDKKMSRKTLVKEAYKVGIKAGREANDGKGFLKQYDDMEECQRIAFVAIVDYVIDMVKSGKVALALLLLACLPLKAQDGALLLHWDPVLDPQISSYNVYVNDGLEALVPQNTMSMVRAMITDLPRETPLKVYLTSVSSTGLESAPSAETVVTLMPQEPPKPPIYISVTIPGELQVFSLVATSQMLLEMSTNLVDWEPLLDLRILDERFVPMVMNFRFPGHLEGALFFRSTP